LKRKWLILFASIVILSLIIVPTISGCQTAVGTEEEVAVTEAAEQEASEAGDSGVVAEEAAVQGIPEWSPGSDKLFNDQIRKIIADKGLTTIKIGFTNPYMSEYYNEIYAGAYTMMKELNEQYGIKFEYVQSSGATHADAETQIAALKTWGREGFQAVVVCTAAEPSAMDAVFGELLEDGTYPYFFNMPPRVLALNEDSPLDDATHECPCNSRV